MMYVGLPQWSHPKWVRLGITGLEEYARHFNCVEGNTTLYALPKAEIVERWREQTTDDFRFCFKFPATISHWRTGLGNTGSSFPPRSARAICLPCGSFWIACPASLPTAWRSGMLNFLPKVKQK